MPTKVPLALFSIVALPFCSLILVEPAAAQVVTEICKPVVSDVT